MSDLFAVSFFVSCIFNRDLFNIYSLVNVKRMSQCILNMSYKYSYRADGIHYNACYLGEQIFKST